MTWSFPAVDPVHDADAATTGKPDFLAVSSTTRSLLYRPLPAVGWFVGAASTWLAADVDGALGVDPTPPTRRAQAMNPQPTRSRVAGPGAARRSAPASSLPWPRCFPPRRRRPLTRATTRTRSTPPSAFPTPRAAAAAAVVAAAAGAAHTRATAPTPSRSPVTASTSATPTGWITGPVGFASVQWYVPDCDWMNADVVGTLHLDGVDGHSGRIHVEFSGGGETVTKHSAIRTANGNGHVECRSTCTRPATCTSSR